MNRETHLEADHVVDLVHGLLEEPLRSELADHIARCESCAEVVRLRSAELELARSEAPAAVHRLPAPLRRRWPRYATWTGAAAAVLAMVLLWQFGASEPIEYRLPVANVLEPLRSDTGDIARLEAALAHYEAKRYTQAASTLQGSEFAKPMEALRRIYLASALTHADDPVGAIDVLASLDLAAIPEPWRGHGLCVSYVAYVHGDRNDDAAALLPQLTQREDRIGDIAREWARQR